MTVDQLDHAYGTVAEQRTVLVSKAPAHELARLENEPRFGHRDVLEAAELIGRQPLHLERLRQMLLAYAGLLAPRLVAVEDCQQCGSRLVHHGPCLRRDDLAHGSLFDNRYFTKHSKETQP